jgi:hypothetical protein
MTGPGTDKFGSTQLQMAELGRLLSAAGMRVQVTSTCGVLDITAQLSRPDCKPAEVIADEDGYVEVRYWNPPGASPAQIAAVISAVLAAITSAPPATC